MGKTIQLNNVDFELGKSIKGVPAIDHRSIWDCYGRPSNTKVSIYEDWRNWFVRDCDTYNFGICSRNCNFFSIEGVIDVDGVLYYLYITRSHNRAYPIEL